MQAVAGFRQNLESVVASGKKTAVASVGFYQPLMSVVSSVEGGNEAFVVANVDGNAIRPDSLAQAAKAAKEQAGADFGAAVSEVETENGEKLVLVCLADSYSAWGAKVFAEGDESPKALAGAAITKLCEMMSEVAAAGGLAAPEAPKPKKIPWLTIVVTLLGVAAAVVLALLVAFFVGENSEGSETTAVTGKPMADGMVVQAIVPETTTELFAEDETENNRGGSGIGEELEFPLPTSVAGETESTSFVSQQPQIPSASDVQSSQSQPSNSVTVPTKPVTNPQTSATKAPESTTKVPAKPPATVTKPSTAAPKPTKPATAKPTQPVTVAPKPTAASPKPTTPPTTKPVPVTKPPEAAAKSGTFVFTTYGWGHGVGMSQEGAIAMAKSGSDYKEILLNYYPGTTIKTDPSTPETVRFGGVDYGLVEYLCKTSFREIGNSAPKDALKAQIVAVYTFAKTYNFKVDSSRHAFSAGWAYEGTATHKACLEVLGMSSASDTPEAVYVDYKGSPAFTCYFASSPGKTASASSVWGGTYSYLSGGSESPEEVEVAEFRISSEEMKKLILAYDKGIVLGDDPSKWITVVSHDGAYNSSIGYASVVRVGNKEMRGNKFRADVCNYKIRSHCFTVKFVPD